MKYDLSSLARSTIRVGPLRVDVGRLMVIDRGEEGRLTPKALALLVELARFPAQTVSRTELLDRLWPGTHSSPDALSHAARELRRALGDDPRSPSLIETVHGLGYRLMVPATIEEDVDLLRSPPLREEQRVEPGVTVEMEKTEIAPAVKSNPAGAPRKRQTGWLVGGLVLAALAASVFFLRTDSPAGDFPSKSSAAYTEGRLLTSDPGAEEFPKISPDGALVVFTSKPTTGGRYDLGLISLSGTHSLPLTQTPDEDELWPAWSPDSERLAFVHIRGNECSIDIMPATGGQGTSLANCDRVIFSAIDWSLEGDHLLTSLPSALPGRELRLHRLPIDGGTPEPIAYHADYPGWDRDPVYSPDGNFIAFRRGLPPDYDIFVIPSSGGTARQLTTIGTVGEGLTWEADGRHVVFSSSHQGAPEIFRVDRINNKISSTGIEGTRPHIARGRSRITFQKPRMSVGMLAVSTRELDLVPYEVAPSTGSVGFMSGAPDMKRFAYVSDRGGFEQIWIHDQAGAVDSAFGDKSLKRITSLDWSDDGAEILFVARRDGADRAMVLDVRTGAIRSLELSRPVLRDAVSGDPQKSVFALVQSPQGMKLALFTREQGGWRETVSDIPASELVRVPGSPGVFGRTPLRPDLIVQVTQELSVREVSLRPRIYGWAGAQGAIWYLSSPQRATSELRRLDLETGEDSAIRPMPHHTPRRRAGLAILKEHAVLAVLTEDAADVGVGDASARNP